MSWGDTYRPRGYESGAVYHPIGDCTYLKPRREESPFAAVPGKKKLEKLAYCLRQIMVLKGWCVKQKKSERAALEIEVERWNQRMYLIEKGKL